MKLNKLVNKMVKREFIQNHKPLNFNFYQNENDFIVEELPIDFSLKGGVIVLKIRKKNLGTWDLMEILSKQLNIYENEIGYAGLKDKNATTTQYISIPKKYSKELKKFRHSKIEILDSFLHKEKLNIGDLKGNRFSINLHNVDLNTSYEIEKILKKITSFGLPNYFGFQRFGKEIKENIQKAKDLIYGELHIKDRKVEKMLISAYQSAFFNAWLVKRLKASKDNFELLEGDVFKELKTQKLFTPKKISEELKADFLSHKVVPTGLLPGRKVFRAILKAREVESKFDDSAISEKGYRRDALVFPKDISCKYNQKEQIFTLKFSLPKGSYATVLIENIANRNFNF